MLFISLIEIVTIRVTPHDYSIRPNVHEINRSTLPIQLVEFITVNKPYVNFFINFFLVHWLGRLLKKSLTV